MSTSMSNSESKSVSPAMIGAAILVLLLFIGFLYSRFGRAGQPVAEQVTIPPEARAHLGVPPPAPARSAQSAPR